MLLLNSSLSIILTKPTLFQKSLQYNFTSLNGSGNSSFSYNSLPFPPLPTFFFISELLSSSQDGLGAGGLVGGGGQGGEEAGRGHGQALRPGNTHHITSLALPPGIFKTHCHLLQVCLQHITFTSCRYLYNTSLPPSPAPGAVEKKPCTGGGSIINGVTSSSFLLLPFSSCS